MKPHWVQACGSPERSSTLARKLRLAGAAALLLSLVCCLAADHPSMATLVWAMAVSTSALAIAMALAYRPQWLAWLVGVKRGRNATP
jgi:hypothetical protein